MPEEKTDLRVRKTHQAIRNAFKEMVMEMDASKITVTELARRANIHRKTFYLHYTGVDDLYEEVFQETLKQYQREIDKIAVDAPFSEANRVFFTFLASREPYVEKMFCDPNYNSFMSRMFLVSVEYNHARYNPFARYSREQQNLISIYLGLTSISFYRQWTADGKKMPLDDLISLTGQLFMYGITSLTQMPAEKTPPAGK